jgi:catechol 2,3-dioxygenase-like lactoylglutathione lyase family enzyme
MLADYPIHAALPATNLERARRFYSEKLGLTPESEAPGGIFYRSAQTRLLVFPSRETASGTHTQAGWAVDDIETEVATLKARGVIFEEYTTPLLTTVDGVAVTDPAVSPVTGGSEPHLQAVNNVASPGLIKLAWFKDSEGNLLALTQLG